jgi:hypothetical protein
MRPSIPDSDVAMHLGSIERFTAAIEHVVSEQVAAGILAWRGKELVETKEAVHGTR